MIYHRNFDQRSAEWFRVRAAIPTASNFHKIVTPGGKASEQAEGYMNYLLAEFYLGRSLEDDNYQSHWMERGQELEDNAIKAYEFHIGQDTEACAFITSDDGLIGCSPDRLVGEDAGMEMKIPKAENHMAVMRNPNLDAKHRCQVQGNLWLSGRKRWDVVSYHPQMPLVVLPVYRDEEYILKLQAGVEKFVSIMLQLRFELETKYGPFVRPEPKADPHEGFGVGMEDVDAILNATFPEGMR